MFSLPRAEWSEPVRVRFAPSPTGYLHVGGARTALFNWLFARHNRGTFVLRIEDTDLARSTEESVTAILDSLRWLGLDWDEGPDIGGPYAPYVQTERLDLYQHYAQKLVEAGRAYWCFCTPEELEERRQQARDNQEAWKYDRKCLHLTPQEQERLRGEGRQPVLRFYSEDTGATVVDDLIRGRMRFENDVLEDFVLLKHDGVPTYNFAAVVDDASMKITHVIRGDDHISNTPKQIQIYRALGWEPPKFAHLSMILGPDHTRLSKRHGATSVGQYKDNGYLPEAMINYLALLGWSLNATEQIFSREELIRHFTLERVGKNPAVFDNQKLEWMNGVYLRKLSPEQLTQAAWPFMQAGGLVQEPSPAEAPAEVRQRVQRALQLMQTRVRTLAAFPEAVRYFFTADNPVEEAAAAFLAQPGAAARLQKLADRLEATEPFHQENIQAAFAAVQEELGISAGELIHPARAALTGRKVSPGIYDVVELLGRDESVRRLRQAAGRS
ncbi:MAG: glutamate--tRNA ligase [Firmicutes bacterium]|nr:glutamate--tRNA ligase [Bacillota bacterium]